MLILMKSLNGCNKLKEIKSNVNKFYFTISVYITAKKAITV